METTDLMNNEINKHMEKVDKWISDTYKFWQNEFGKKVMYDGVEYIVIGLQPKSEIEDSGKQFDGGYSLAVKHEMYIVLKSSFTNTIEISVNEYLSGTRRTRSMAKCL